MITLEDQIRRYATDVAGPAVAEAPTDLLDLGRPHHRGRWVLVAALVVFIAGLAWVATRPAELSDAPTVDTVPASAPAPGSWPVGHASCISEPAPFMFAPTDLEGVGLGGPNGDGICIAIDPKVPDQVWVAVNGTAYGQTTVNECTFIGGNGGGVGFDVDGHMVLMVVVDRDVDVVGFAGAGDLAAQAFDLPGLDRRVAALMSPEEGRDLQAVSFFSADGSSVESRTTTSAPRTEECWRFGS